MGRLKYFGNRFHNYKAFNKFAKSQQPTSEEMGVIGHMDEKRLRSM